MSPKVRTYVIGYVTSIILTLIAFALVIQGALPAIMIVVVIVGLAIVQLIVQLVFFLHIGSGTGSKWKVTTFAFAILTVFIVVGGSIWIMNNLNYNMLHLEPEQQKTYLKNNEGI